MVLHVIAACVLTALAGYLLGSVLFGVLVSKTMVQTARWIQSAALIWRRSFA